MFDQIVEKGEMKIYDNIPVIKRMHQTLKELLSVYKKKVINDEFKNFFELVCEKKV